MNSKMFSGQLGWNPRYQFERVIQVVAGENVGLILSMDRKEAERLVRWHRPDIIGPIAEQLDVSDDDSFLDALILAVDAWVGTFPGLREAVADGA